MLFLVSIVSISGHINDLTQKCSRRRCLTANPYVVFFYDSDMIKDEEGHGALRDMETSLQNAVSPYGIGFATLTVPPRKREISQM